MTTATARFHGAVLLVAIAVCGTLALWVGDASAQATAPYRPGVVLVGFEPGVSSARRHELASRVGRASRTLVSPSDVAAARSAAERPSVKRSVRDIGPVVELHVPSGTEQSAIRRLSGAPGVRYAEPDYLMRSSAAAAARFSNPDAFFDKQWGLQNTGQSVNGKDEGTPGADERAVDAWGVETGSREIVVGETDTGVKYDHPDLAANVWTNPGGIGGCPAGTHGFNEIAQTCDPMDDEVDYGGHGTHVAGILGAVGDNGIGVTGVNWQTTILPVKAADSHDWGTTGQLIAGLQWLVDAKNAGVNVRVINDSQTYRGTARSDALSQELDVLASHDILFVTAAGNTGEDNDDDAFGRYPCRYPQDNVICVTASDQRDELATFEEDVGSANYGAQTVDLAAPGDDIYSTKLSEAYGYISGGSMASPQVAGTAALILSADPSLSATEVKARILDNVDPLPSLSDKVLTGGRLNVCDALPGCDPPETTITSGPGEGSTTTDATPSFEFASSETGSSFECKVDSDAFARCDSPRTVGAFMDGPHSFVVRATDRSGNVDPRPASRSFTVDTTAPLVGMDAVTSPRKSVPVLSGHVGSASGDVDRVHVDVGRGGVSRFAADVTPNGSHRWTVELPAALANGDYTATVTQDDAAGNSGSAQRAFTLDGTAPAPTVTAPSGDIRQAKPTLEGAAGGTAGSSPDDAALTIRLSDGTTTTPATITRTGDHWSLPLSAALPDGRYTATAQQGDAAGNAGTSEPRPFRVDTQAPDVTLEALDAEGNDATPTVRGSAGAADGTGVASHDDAVSVDVYAGDSAAGIPLHTVAATRDGVNGFSATPAAALADGTYTAVARQSDAAGNAGASPPGTFKVDTTAPAPKLDAPPEWFTDRKPALTGTRGKAAGDLDPVTVTIKRGTATVETLHDASTGASWSVTPTADLPDGSYTVTVTQADAAGNDADPVIRTFHVDAPAPLATTEAAGGVSQIAAKLHGSVNPNGSAVSECRFDYGATTSYGSRVPCAERAGDGSAPVDVSASLSGLHAGTTYHFRLVADSARGTGMGDDQTFVTLPTTPPPSDGGDGGPAPGGDNPGGGSDPSPGGGPDPGDGGGNPGGGSGPGGGGPDTPPAGTGPGTPPPGTGPPRTPHQWVPAELEVSRVRIRHRRLEVMATMTDEADGDRVQFALHARGHRFSFSKQVRNGRLRFHAKLPRKLRRAHVGRVKISYRGSDTVRPAKAMLHAAERKASLRVRRLRLRGTDLVVKGTVSRYARGKVSLVLRWADDQADLHTRKARANISHRHWRLEYGLPEGARDGGSVAVIYPGHGHVQGEQAVELVTP